MGNVEDDYSAEEFFSWVECADYVHDQTCPKHRPHLRAVCPHGLRVSQARAALDYLAKKPNDAQGARRVLHGLVCIACKSDAERDQHAQSTQLYEQVSAVMGWKGQQ